MRDSGERLKVLSVVGAGRSGTTLVAGILGEVPGFVGAGEIRWLWRRGVVEGGPCGCGNPPQRCPVWSPVVSGALERLAAGSPPVTVAEILAAQHELERPRNMLRVVKSLDGRGDGTSLDGRDGDRARDEDWLPLTVARRAVGAVVDALAEATDARVLVDTSKRAVDAALVESSGAADHYVLHLVRDPRGVVHSWGRAKTVTAAGRTWTLDRRGMPASVRRWNRNALMADALRARIPSARWLHLRYEDFAAAPRPAVERVLAFLGEDGPTPFVDERSVSLGPNHIVVGNPSRFTTGRVAVRSDDAWRTAMPAWQQRLVMVSTLPFSARFGYWGAAVPGSSDGAVRVDVPG